MKRLTKIFMPALMLGTAAFAVPALAQNEASPSGDSSAAAAAPAQPAQDANNAAAPSSSSASSSAGSQMAMNTTGNAGDLSSIPDTKQKYSKAKRNTDNQSEDQTTKQLNQQEASLNGASRGSAQ